MWIVELTWLNAMVTAVVVYYLFLYAVLGVKRLLSRKRADCGYRPFVFVVVPAHNEEAVIAHTIESQLRQTYPHRAIMIMNDGSTDRTSEIAHAYEATHPEVMVVDRGTDVAGRGKGAVLNHAYAIVRQLVADADPRIGGVGAGDVLVGVTDADGQLERQALEEVARYFAEEKVGGVQIGVRIANSSTNLLTRMQDIEFVGFSAFVQEARDVFGSVGLGGNGQFTRLSALLSVGDTPWSDCLTEDLDLGLTLVRGGWRIRFCHEAYVAQQAVTSLPALFRQRTRWVQGHYQCWSHLPELVRERRVPIKTRIDLSLYLVLVFFVVLVSLGMGLSLLGLTGAVTLHSTLLLSIPAGPLRNSIDLLLSFGPLCLFLATYQRRVPEPLPLRWLPAYAVIFAVYTYAWLVATLWAWTRMGIGLGAWVKTGRVASEEAV